MVRNKIYFLAVIKASLFLLTGVICAIGVLFVGNLYLSIPLVIFSLILFAFGWDKINDIRHAASISGAIVWPHLAFPVKRDPRIELTDESGHIFAETYPNDEGAFSFPLVPDGVWVVRAISTWMDAAERRIEIHRRQKLDLGSIPINFSLNKIWQTETVPFVSQIQDAMITKDGDIWVVGFQSSKDHRNTRKFVTKRPGEPWKEVIVPALEKAERATSISELSNKYLLLGSLRAGAAFSMDAGKTWSPVSIPDGVDSVLGFMELPDNSIIAHAWEWRGGRPGNAVILKYTDDLTIEPIVTASFEEVQFENVFLTEPGRLLVSTKSLSKGGAIFISEDFGETWKPSTIQWQKANDGANLYGISVFHNLSGGTLAGTLDGRMYKGDHVKRGILLLSRDGGHGWLENTNLSEIGEVCGFCKTTEHSILMLAKTKRNVGEGTTTFISKDDGETWEQFISAPVSGPRVRLKESDEKCLVFGLNRIAVARKSDLSLERLT